MTRPTDARPDPSDYERGAADMQERAADVCEAAYARQQRADGTVGGPLATACMEIAGLPILPDPSAPAQPQPGEEALVERLRRMTACAPGCEGRCQECPDDLMQEAAAEIERLRAALIAIRAHKPDVRAQALEEAAQVCDVSAGQSRALGDVDGHNTAECCAVEIRALIAAPSAGAAP